MRIYLLFLFLYISIGTNAQTVLKPKQLVNIFGSKEIDKISFKQIFIVPVDSILVITDFLIDGYYSTNILYSDNEPIIRLDKNTWVHTCTGIQFESGSQIKLYNEANFSYSISYHLIGYLQKLEKK